MEFPPTALPLRADTVDVENELYKFTFRGEWEKVVELYKTEPWLQRRGITSSKDTALHMAISDDREHVVEILVRLIMEQDNIEALKTQNDRGETPLHRAATRESTKMCKCILEAGDRMGLDLLSITNKRGETPIFTAALHNRKPVFFFLHRYACDDTYRNKPYELVRRKLDADTVLHCAIGREHFDLAFHIIKLYPDLVGKFNDRGITPLHVLVSKPSAFRSGHYHHLTWCQKIIYTCMPVHPLEFRGHYDEREILMKQAVCPENYLTCFQFFRGWCSCVFGCLSIRWCSQSRNGSRISVRVSRDSESLNSSRIKDTPPNYTTCFDILTVVHRIFFGVMVYIFKDIKKAKQMHKWSVQILDELMAWPGKACARDIVEIPSEFHDGIEDIINQKDEEVEENKKAEEETGTALLVAAKNGVIEAVDKILSELPVSVYDTSSNNKNILLVAVEDRQPRILEALLRYITTVLNKPNLWDELIQSVDTDGNNILHLAAKYESQIQGSSALQMQQEIKWYEYVKSFLPSHYTFLKNKDGETPGQIFLKHHGNLFEKSDEWLSRTSESCSVVAALVAGVAFATSSTVPGGNDEKTGKPTLEGHAGFDIFAVTALMALCFSVTALIMFLSILTSRKQPADFMKKIPVKLFLALSSLFVSIISMFISFCAAHSFVLEDKFKKSVLPLYVIVCLPVSFTIVEFSLYMDLFEGIFMKVQRYDQRRI